MSAQEVALLEKLIRASDPLALADYAHEYEAAMTPTAVAALVVRPTTVAAITFWNGENPLGKDLVLDRIFALNLVTTAAETFASLWYCVHEAMSKPTNDIVTLLGTGDGRVQGSNVIVDQGATVINDGWFPAGIGSQAEAAGVLPGGLLEWEVKGRIKVPPGHGLSLHVVSGVVGDTFQPGAAWHRTQRQGH